MKKWMGKCIAATLVSVLTLSGGAFAQDELDSSSAQVQSGQLDLALDVGYEESFQTDLDDGGDFEFRSYHFNLSLGMTLADDLKMTLGYDFLIDQYDFDGPAGIGALDPWDDVETQNINLLFSHQYSNDWTVFGGPIAVYSRDRGSALNDSGSWGGVAGVSYIYSENLVIGGGLGVITSLEDDTRYFPVIVLQWKLSPDLTLATDTTSARSGVELIYQAGEGMELALGAAYEFKRFRLDDTGYAPDGVAEQTSLPLWFRASFDFDHNTTVKLIGGVRLSGELLIDDRDGNRLNDVEFDPASFVGLSVDIRF